MSQGIRLKLGVRMMLSLVLLGTLVSTRLCYLKRRPGADPVRLLLPTASAIVLFMFGNFSATDRWTKKQVHCVYQAQIVAIATRHADAVDYKFLVDGRKVWVALPHPAWVEYHKRTGTMITDSLGVEIAGHYLKSALEAGEGVGREMYSLTVEETLKHLDAAVAEMQAQPA